MYVFTNHNYYTDIHLYLCLFINTIMKNPAQPISNTKETRIINMGKQRTGLRTFYYFRLGYAQYLAFGVGIVNVLTSTYFLAIDRVPALKSFLPTFEIYIIFCILSGIPLMICFGWLHFKRTGTYSTEISIGQQVSPYNYKWIPGYAKEVFGPAYLAILRANIKRLQGLTLTDAEIEQMKKMENELLKLIQGDHAGNPPKGAFI